MAVVLKIRVLNHRNFAVEKCPIWPSIIDADNMKNTFFDPWVYCPRGGGVAVGDGWCRVGRVGTAAGWGGWRWVLLGVSGTGGGAS